TLLQPAGNRQQPAHPRMKPVENAQHNQHPQLIGGHEPRLRPAYPSPPASSHGTAAVATVRKEDCAQRNAGCAPWCAPRVPQPAATLEASDQALSEHRLSDDLESSDVGTCHIVAGPPIAFRRLI